VQEEFSSAQEEKPSEQSESSSAQAEASSTLEGVASSQEAAVFILFIPKNTPFLSIKKCPIMQKRLHPPIPDNREANILSVLVGIS